MTVWQRVECDEDLCYQAEGRYLAAPGHRRSLRLQVSVGRTRGQVELVSDGCRLWQMQRVGAGQPVVSLLELPAGSCQEFLQRRGLAGAGELVTAIRVHLQQPRRETIRWGGRQVYRITGEWPTDAARLASLPEDLPATVVPRRCRVYLDARTLWPCRVEWWGQDPSGGGDVLLSQIEFRDPVVGRPLPPEQCAREFAFPPVSP
jgi:hypothetical protein